MIYAATGHRPDKLDGYYSPQAQKALFTFATIWLDRHREDVTQIISGLALGWDTAIAYAALRCDIPLIGAIPFDGQHARWPLKSQMFYHALVKQCTKIEIISEAYSKKAFQKRNEWMVDNAQAIVALWNGTAGGTANCLRYAATRPLISVTNLWDQWTEYRR